MCNIRLLCLAGLALVFSAAPLTAQCHMQYNVSVYTDGSVSGDLSTVYGSSSFVDNSTLCGATHSNYQSLVTIYAPGGSNVSNQNSGMESNTSMLTNGVLGTYDVVGDAYLDCSIGGEIESGGPSYDVPVTASVSLTVGSTGGCTLHLQNSTCNFVVGAYAGGGFTGTVSGSITVSAPQNPNGVMLSNGSGSQDYPFTLSAGQSTSGTCNNPPSFCFVVTTDAANHNTGTLTYGVTLNNGTNYTVPSGHQTQEVTLQVVN